jgi:hypothetical protein
LKVRKDDVKDLIAALYCPRSMYSAPELFKAITVENAAVLSSMEHSWCCVCLVVAAFGLSDDNATRPAGIVTAAEATDAPLILLPPLLLDEVAVVAAARRESTYVILIMVPVAITLW